MNYPLLNVFWTLLIFFGFIIWVMLLFRVLADIFHSHDLSGPSKAGWLILTILLPFVGVVFYLIARGSDMGARQRRDDEHFAAHHRGS